MLCYQYLVFTYSETINYNFHRKKYWFQKFPGLDLEELNYNVSKICTLLKLKRNKFKIIEIYPGCFCIEKI